MSADRTAPALRYIRSLAPSDAAPLPDQELLARFIADRDPTAFAELVARHGPMVYRLCRRVARNDHDAEDAFQATFLVLARRAAAVRRRAAVACWLYGVARRIAGKAKVAAARRVAREGHSAGPGPADPLDEISVAEAREVLDQELARLPEKFRNPLVLCCLQGLARDEAARQLGWSVSVLKSRLEQGRDRLRDRLARRGLTLAGALGTSLLGGQATAAVPAALLDHTVHAAVVVATGGAPGSIVSINSAALTREVLTTMFVKKLSFWAAFSLIAGLVATGLIARPTAEAAPAKTGGKPEVATDKDKLQGTWEVVELVKGGAKVMPTADVQGTVELKGDGFRFVLTPTGMDAFTRTTATFTLDTAKSPKAIDVTPTEGAGKGQVAPGIYEAGGDDLTICLAEGLLEARPTAFEATKDNVVLFKLKRVKK